MCRYAPADSASSQLPYALVSKQLLSDLRGRSADRPARADDRLAELLKMHGARLDDHMQLANDGLRWEPASSDATSLLAVTGLMRRTCVAREQSLAGASGGREGATPNYDAGRRNEPLEIAERYHKRRIVLFAEPQVLRLLPRVHARDRTHLWCGLRRSAKREHSSG